MATQEPRRRGRPVKLTPQVQHMIITAIEAGSTTKEAARAAGIHRAGIYRQAAEGRKPGAKEDLRAFAAAFARAGAERSRKSVTREGITDGHGRVIGTRVTRRLKNGTVEVTEEFTRPDRRALLAQVRESARAEGGALEQLLGRA